jgi:hypothetical protein
MGIPRMSDFYSVLKQSIIDRSLRSANQRETAYTQARTAMIRRLWSYDPPLAEDEIDTRIGQFDLAVERIENEVIEVFAALPEPVAAGPDSAATAAPPAPPVYDGYDEQADYAPAFGGAPPERAKSEAHRRKEATPSDRDASNDVSSLSELLASLDVRSLAVEEALNADAGAASPATEGARSLPGDAPSEAPTDDDEYERDGDEASRDATPHVASDDAEDPAFGQNDSPDAYDSPETADFDAPPRRRPQIDEGSWPAVRRRARSAGGRTVAILIAAVGALAVVLIGVTAYVLWPSSTHQPPAAAATAPPAEAAEPGSAARVPPPAANARRFTLFSGGDPTVFDADSSNPIRFNGSAARISTSADSAGARAIVGPGLATRLAGHNIRVTVMARSARENGASSLRLAYQSGLAISHWQTANLTAQFAAIQLDWRVPSMQTDPTGNLIIIEPGIPGDGTGAEIGAITIDVLD